MVQFETQGRKATWIDLHEGDAQTFALQHLSLSTFSLKEVLELDPGTTFEQE